MSWHLVPLFQRTRSVNLQKRAQTVKGIIAAYGVAVCACLALFAAFCSPARAERDTDFVAKLRQGGFTQLAEMETNRLLAKTDLNEDSRVALLLEKARILELKAVAAQLDDNTQIELIGKAQDVLKAFINQYAARPEKTDAAYELQFLNRVLGLLYVRKAQFETDPNACNDLVAKGRAALDEASAGYGALRQEFEKRRDDIKAQLQAQNDLHDKEAAKLKPSLAVLKGAERKIHELEGKLSAAEFSVIQCRYLEADSVGGLGKALKKIPGHEAEGDGLLDKAITLYNGLFSDYRKTPYIEVAYRSLSEAVRMQCLRGQAEDAYRRIQTETVYFLTTYRQEMEKDPAFKRIAAYMHLVTAETLNALGKYKEAEGEAKLAGLGPQNPLKDDADVEIATAYKGEGNIDGAASLLADVIARNSGAQRGAIDLVLQWIKEKPEIRAKFPADVQYNLAMLLYNQRRYAETENILSALVESVSGADETKWAPPSLLYIALVRCKQAEAKKAELTAAGNEADGKAAYVDGLKNAVSVIMDRLVVKYGGDKTPEGQSVLRRALYLALDWQNQVVTLGGEKEQKTRLEDILAAFNSIFPGASNIPDANFLRGVGLETDGKYQEAIDAYSAVAPDRNQSVIAKLRIALCNYRIYRQKKNQPVEEFKKQWDALNAGIDAVNAKLNDPAAKLEESEKAQFTTALAEGEYIRALLLFYASDKEAAAVLEAGADKNRRIIDLVNAFMQRYPDSAYAAQATFMLAHSKIAVGEGEAAEADVQRLEAQGGELYQNALAAIRDSYFNLYLEARKKQDNDAARKYGEKFIAFAAKFAEKFPEAVSAGDNMNMGNYLFQAGRFDEAAARLRQAWAAFDDGLKNHKFTTPEAKSRAEAALRVVGDRLGEALLNADDADKAKEAGGIYARLYDLRRAQLAENLKGAELDKALRVDASARYYAARGAMATVSIQAHAGGELPDMDSLGKAVDILAESARMYKSLIKEWWMVEYWVARGLLTQRDFKMAAKVCDNVKAISGDFKPESGAQDAAVGGKTFKQLFEDLVKEISSAQNPQS